MALPLLLTICLVLVLRAASRPGQPRERPSSPQTLSRKGVSTFLYLLSRRLSQHAFTDCLGKVLRGPVGQAPEYCIPTPGPAHPGPEQCIP